MSQPKNLDDMVRSLDSETLRERLSTVPLQQLALALSTTSEQSRQRVLSLYRDFAPRIQSLIEDSFETPQQQAPANTAHILKCVHQVMGVLSGQNFVDWS